MDSQQRLIARFTHNLPLGTLEWIGLRSERRGRVLVVDRVTALEGRGLDGDRRCQGTPGSARQVTLISREEIGLIAGFLGLDAIPPELLRRNLVISGVNLHALRHQRFRIGTAEFEATAQCHPCSRMEEALGEGAVAAMLGHGGLCAKIIRSGVLAVGDRVEKL